MTKAELFTEYERLKLENQGLKAAAFLHQMKIKKQAEEISILQEKINILEHAKFAPQSEKLRSKDDQVFNEAEEVNSTLPDDIVENDDESNEYVTITYKRKKQRRPRIDKELPRVVQVIDLDDKDKVCPHDGSRLKEIGEEVLEQLEIIPEHIKVLRWLRKKYACPCCDEGLKVAPVPPSILPKSMATPALIAYIAISKYQDALPLYRQEQIFMRLGFIITRQTMARWIIRCASKLMPIYNLLNEKLLECNYVQMDETPLQVLKEKGKKATSKSYMWARHAPGNQPIVLFDYDPTRSGSVPTKLLEGFKGFLQCDGYNGYAPICSNKDVTRVGCLDHARRYFHKAFKTSGGKGVGKKGLILIDKLYKIEKKIAGLTAEEKQAVRVAQSLPALNELHSWATEIRLKINPSSAAGKAVNYLYNEWETLTVYTRDGNLNISNIWVENKIRPFCLGRKNWLFSVSVEGAEASAMFYSLIETAKANGLNPFDYLKKLMEEILTASTLEDFVKLLPFA